MGTAPKRRVWAVAAMVVALWPSRSLAQGSDGLPSAVVLGVDAAPVEPGLAAARFVGGARWSGAQLASRPPATEQPPAADIAALRQHWANVESSRCLARLQTPALDIRELLRREDRASAASVLVLHAACLLGDDDADGARVVLERAVAMDLPIEAELAGMSIALQRMAQSVEEASAGSRRQLLLRTRPGDAEVFVDGRPCESRPCRLALRAGEHVVAARRLGFRPRVETLLVDEDREVTLALDPAAADEQLRQLAVAVGAGLAPGELPALRAASAALGAPIVLVTWASGDDYRLTLFDRRRPGPGAVAGHARSERDEASLAAATRSLVRDWRALQPIPLVEEPVFWIVSGLIAGAIAAAAAVTAHFLSQEPEPRFVIVGR